ncbi:hypothetical protein [Amycolatopsis regifaucium]|uniref:Uncharacterized protein n=1 Tax=Amycolatopsis regifaucium TaxID=546365 RepID=A0A154MUM2_9PSEU|nr:hypothetical protein [Amycolatopsis regifaucium]KZB87996.1 hypothetical protein AVL48_18590 [Amycolatopsis regifaucium]OKA04498.1 hypothetical protein ATP06_0231920 [Amycolatopsis regifaucium]SFH50661.1 hypothetical protein SAMN04489731_104525 [Amycolatopsis regifaucium]
MNHDIVDQGAGDFLVERRGAHVLIRRIGEADLQAGAIGWPEPVDGHVFVLVSPGAARDGSLTTALPALLHRSVVAKDVEAVRIALPGFGRDPFVPQALADALNVEIFAPDGTFVVEPGALLYAGHGTGGTGWLRFRPGAPACPDGRRYPVPAWEAAMPATPSGVPGAIIEPMPAAILEPVPAGLLVRRPDARPATLGDAAFSVPADPSVAKIVVGAEGAVPAAGLVSTVVGRLPLVPTTLVPLSTTTSAHAWLSEFAKSLSRNVVVEISPTDVKKRYRPFVAKLLQRADGGQEVLEAVVPPRGWQRRDASGYRRGQVMADVVPSGLVLRTGAGDSAASAASFDPEAWTLYLGTPGEPIGPDLLSAAEALLGELVPETRNVARLRLLGVLDDRTRELIDRPPAIVTRPVPATGQKRAEPAKRTETRVAPSAPAGPAAATPRPQGGPVMPAALMVSSAPVPTVSGAAAAVPAQEPVAKAQPSPAVPAFVTPQQVPATPVEAPSVTDTRSDDTVPAPMPVVEETRMEVSNRPVAEVAETREPAKPVEPRVATGTALVVADRASTAAEQARFTAAAGDEYGEALATVNAALATWPSMRGQADTGIKADYVAVCLYLGRGRGGFGDLNPAVRGGTTGEIEGQVTCLASGLRRLPTHRRAVLRQSKDAQALERTITPGSILTEPGFLVGSMDLDVTVPDAELDVLIWPASARRTSELLIGQPVNEVVFFAGARFKALALRETEPAGEEQGEEPAAPRVAALFRELAPNEAVPVSGELDDHDLAVLAKLDRALERRHRGALRLIEEPGLTSRMTSALYEWREEASAPATAGRTVTLAS